MRLPAVVPREEIHEVPVQQSRRKAENDEQGGVCEIQELCNDPDDKKNDQRAVKLIGLCVFKDK